METKVPGGVGNRNMEKHGHISDIPWTFHYSQTFHRLHSGLSGNVHRGMHTLSMRSTEAFEGARKKVADFVHAPDVHEPWLRIGPR